MIFALLFAFLFLAFTLADCPGQNLLPRPEKPHEFGPWPVGVRTVQITERNMTVEIWYPAVLGSEQGEDFEVYSMRDEHLPPDQAVKIPDDENPLQNCDCYRDLPMDYEHGPYPVHIHIHGTAGFRQISLHQMTHFASRGFVVVAADHPGITMYDMMQFGNGNQVDQTGDAYRMIEELETMRDPQLAFLEGHIDISMLAISGHSAGGGAVAPMGDKAKVLMPWCGGSAREGDELESAFILAGENDNYAGRQRSYDSSAEPKRFVGVQRAGHVFPTDLCWIGEDDGGIVEIAVRNGIYLAIILAPLMGDSCDEGSVYNEPAWDITNYASTAIQEEILMCDESMPEKMSNIQNELPYVLDYIEDL